MAEANSTHNSKRPSSDLQDRELIMEEDNFICPPEDLKLIEARLTDIYHSQRAIGELAIDALDSDRAEACSIAIYEMARANVKGLLACIEKLTGEALIGDHREEFGRF